MPTLKHHLVLEINLEQHLPQTRRSCDRIWQKLVLQQNYCFVLEKIVRLHNIFMPNNYCIRNTEKYQWYKLARQRRSTLNTDSQRYRASGIENSSMPI